MSGDDSTPGERISTAADPRLADYRDLRDPRARQRIEGDEFFICEGPVAFQRLLASEQRPRSVLVLERRLGMVLDLLDGRDVPLLVVDETTMREVTGFDLHRGVVAAADRLPRRSIDEVIGVARRIVVLEGLNDPENLGAISRSARALGADAMIIDPTCIDPYTRRTVRVSMGEILHLPWARASSIENAYDRLRGDGVDVWALTPDRAADSLFDLTPPDRLAIVLGAEGSGLPESTLRRANRRVRIPTEADVDSLNVAAAAAVALSHLRI